MEEWHKKQEEYADWAKEIEGSSSVSPMETLWRYKEKIYNKAILKYSADGMTGLEIGSGAGRTCKFLKENGRYVIGIDPLSHNNIYNLVTNPLLSAVGEYLPFRDGSFDFVITKATIDHSISPQEVFKEVNRVLKDNGYFMVCQNVKEKDRHHQHVFEIKTIKGLGRRANFSLLRTIPLFIRIPIPSWRLRMALIRSKLYVNINRIIATILARYAHHLIFVLKKTE